MSTTVCSTWPVEQPLHGIMTEPTIEEHLEVQQADDVLVQAARQGDAEAFGMLIERHRQFCMKVALRIVRNPRISAFDCIYWRTGMTTMVYTHVLNRGGRGVRSPLDCLQKASWDMPEAIVNTMVASPGRRRRLCLRPTRIGLIQVSLNKS